MTDFVLFVSSTYGRTDRKLDKGPGLNESKFRNSNLKCTWMEFRASLERQDAE